MLLSRALLGTALGLSLAGCAMQTASTATPAHIAQVNRTAAASFAGISPASGPNTGIQLASLETVLPSQPQAAPQVVQKGTVLWHRTAEESELPAKPEVSEEITRLRESLQQLQGQNTRQLAELEQRLKASQEEKERAIRAQATETVNSVATLAQQSLKSMETVARSNSENWNSTTQQMAQLEGRMQHAVTDTQQRQALTEQRVQNTLASAEQRQNLAAQQLQTTLAGVEKRQTLAEARSLSDRELTTMQLAELRKLNAETRTEAGSEIANVSQALRLYADAQFQQAAATTSATVASLAQATNQSVAGLREQTNQRLGVLWQAANQRAEQLAEAKANGVAASLAALQQQTESRRLKPEQIRAIAEQTVADSTPEFRAIALSTMQEGQDYIRTIARSAVQDKDPAMSAALAEAARDVITKDDKIVFAIRKAVAEELHGLSTDQAATPTMKMGPDHDAAMGTELDPNRLRIAQLLAPGTNTPAPDAVAGTDLAGISPASGPTLQAPASAGGQQSWSVPGTSLTRSRNRADWMDIRQYKVVVHEDDQTLEELLNKVLKHAQPFTGPWQVRWKITDQNRDVMTEKFSLDAETTFEEFVSYLAQYVVNDRGVKLSFSLFDNERIIVISD